jgi:hypothetical protein
MLISPKVIFRADTVDQMLFCFAKGMFPIRSWLLVPPGGRNKSTIIILPNQSVGGKTIFRKSVRSFMPQNSLQVVFCFFLLSA